jgi:CII-binding regulator of phage lambda lysogenization HflD
MKSQESMIIKYKQRQKELERSIKDKSSTERKLLDNQQEFDRLNQIISQSKKKLKVFHVNIRTIKSDLVKLSNDVVKKSPH